MYVEQLHKMHEKISPPPLGLKTCIHHDIYHLLGSTTIACAIWHHHTYMHGLRTSSSRAINRYTHSRTQEAEAAAAEMATLGGTRLTTCNDRCGCPTPCPGGLSCRCATRTVPGTVDDHKKCSCGEHCGCNPCTCAKSAVTTGVGKAHCKCGDACTCVSCAA